MSEPIGLSHLVRVAIVDDHPLLSAALTRTIESDPHFELVATASTSEQAMAMLHRHSLDVLVLDMDMYGLDGRRLLGRIRTSQVNLRVLVISEHHTGEVVLDVLTAGAAGYLSKRATSAEVLAAIAQVAHGDAVLPSEIGTDLAATLRERGSSGSRPTAREIKVLELLSNGESAKEMAAELHLAVPTIRSHIKNLYVKLGVNSRGAAVAEAIRRGLIG